MGAGGDRSVVASHSDAEHPAGSESGATSLWVRAGTAEMGSSDDWMKDGPGTKAPIRHTPLRRSLRGLRFAYPSLAKRYPDSAPMQL